MIKLGTYNDSTVFHRESMFPKMCSEFERIKKIVEILDGGAEYAKYGRTVLFLSDGTYILGPTFKKIQQSDDKLSLTFLSKVVTLYNVLYVTDMGYCNPDGFLLTKPKHSCGFITGLNFVQCFTLSLECK